MLTREVEFATIYGKHTMLTTMFDWVGILVVWLSSLEGRCVVDDAELESSAPNGANPSSEAVVTINNV